MRIIGIDRKQIETKPYVHPNQTIRSLGEKMKRQMIEASRQSNPAGIIDLTSQRELRRSDTRRRAAAITPRSGQDAYEGYAPMLRREMI